MSKILTIKIDVTKIDKSALYEGTKGKYATLTVFLEDGMDDYGQSGMVTQDLGQQRREAGEKGPILGNVTRVFDKDARSQPQGQGQRRREPAANQMDDQARGAQRGNRQPAPQRGGSPPPQSMDDDQIPF